MLVPVPALQQLDDLRHQVGVVPGGQQVRHHLLPIFVPQDLTQGAQQLLKTAHR